MCVKRWIAFILCVVMMLSGCGAKEKTSDDIQNMVYKVLDNAELARTSAPYCVYDPGLSNSQGYGIEGMSVLYQSVEYAREKQVNPIAALLALKKAGLFEEVTAEQLVPGYLMDEEDFLQDEEVVIEYWGQTFEYTEEGVEWLLEEILWYTELYSDNRELFWNALDRRGFFQGTICWAEEDDCYYAYQVVYDSAEAYMLCWYFRSDNGETITDVEFQLLCGRYYADDMWAGSSESFSRRRMSELELFVALAENTEYLLTGETEVYANVYQELPLEYSVGAREVSVSLREFYGVENYVESAQVYTFRIR